MYLLTDIDVPWIADIVRYLPESFMQKCIEELEKRNLPYIKLSGSWDNRFEKACQAIDNIIEKLQ